MKDFRDGTSPGPGQYEGSSELHAKPNKIYLNRTTRMPAKRFETESPGPGTYRHQDGFGLYSTDDPKGNLINMIGASGGKTLRPKLKHSPYKSVNKLKHPSRYLTKVIEEEEQFKKIAERKGLTTKMRTHNDGWQQANQRFRKDHNGTEFDAERNYSALKPTFSGT
jgi:hypothetical protein